MRAEDRIRAAMVAVDLDWELGFGLARDLVIKDLFLEMDIREFDPLAGTRGWIWSPLP